MTDTDTTRLADIRRRCEMAQDILELKILPKHRSTASTIVKEALADIEWLLAQLDDATIRGDKLYQYGQTADAVYAEADRLLIERDEWRKRATDGLRDLLDDQSGAFSETTKILAENVKLHATIARLQQAAHDIEHGYEMPYERHTYTATDPAADRSGWQERAEVAAAALIEMEAECEALRAERDAWRERARDWEKEFYAMQTSR